MVIGQLLDDHAVFYSPAVFTPQHGCEKLESYLLAAEKMFTGNDFRYTNGAIART
jgi:hypothetical protein